MAVSRSLRFQVLRRDGHRCHYCGATAAQAKLTVDHITAVALGGTDTADNLVTACEPCNGGKSATPADAALVAQVQERDTQFRAAVEVVTEVDRRARWFAEAFLDAWDLGELPPGWRKTIDAYRQQGLTSDAWDDIVAIARNKPNLDDPFRYCCGIARNQVKKIQEQAARELGAPSAETVGDDDARKARAVREAAFACWFAAMGGDEEPPTSESVATFRSSLDELDEMDLLDPGRVIAAAEHGGWFAIAHIKQAFRDIDFRDAWRAWVDAWPQAWEPDPGNEWGGGRWVGGPDARAQEWATEQINALLDAGVHVSRVVQAATYAGFHSSARLYRGLTPEELKASRVSPDSSQALQIWRSTRTAGTGQEPTDDERNKFFASVHRAATAYANETYGLLTVDIWQAAAWAGAYEDWDISTCLPLRTSVFEAAAVLPSPVPPE